MDEIAGRATILNVSYFKHILFRSISKFIFRIQTAFFEEYPVILYPPREIYFYDILSQSSSVDKFVYIYSYNNQNKDSMCVCMCVHFFINHLMDTVYKSQITWWILISF